MFNKYTKYERCNIINATILYVHIHINCTDIILILFVQQLCMCTYRVVAQVKLFDLFLKSQQVSQITVYSMKFNKPLRYYQIVL